MAFRTSSCDKPPFLSSIHPSTMCESAGREPDVREYTCTLMISHKNSCARKVLQASSYYPYRAVQILVLLYNPTCKAAASSIYCRGIACGLTIANEEPSLSQEIFRQGCAEDLFRYAFLMRIRKCNDFLHQRSLTADASARPFFSFPPCLCTDSPYSATYKVLASSFLKYALPHSGRYPSLLSKAYVQIRHQT